MFFQRGWSGSQDFEGDLGKSTAEENVSAPFATSRTLHELVLESQLLINRLTRDIVAHCFALPGFPGSS